MSELQNQLSMSPKQQFLAFVLDRAKTFYEKVSDSKVSDDDVELAIAGVISFIPDDLSRAELFQRYAQCLETYNVRTSALVVCGLAISALSASMDISDQSSGGFI